MKKSDKKEVLLSKNAAEAPASLKEWKKPCSLEAEMMFAGLEKAKSALAGILANARKLFSDDIKAEIAKEALQISSKDLENLKAALGKGSFYFPLFSAEIGSGQSLSADTDREFGPIVNLIKKDLLDLAVTLEELSPTFSEFITGVPSETSRALRLLPSSEKDEWLNSNSFSLRIHPLVKLVEFNQKEAFFNYFYRYLSLKSKSTIKSLDALGESAEVFLSNALNTNFSPSDPSFFRKKDRKKNFVDILCSSVSGQMRNKMWKRMLMWKMFVDIYLRKSGKILHIPIWHPVPEAGRTAPHCLVSCRSKMQQLQKRSHRTLIL